MIMEPAAVLHLISGGETSRVQFKENVTYATSIAQEMVAFSNAKGGTILIGVNDKTGEVTGLTFADVQRINSLLSTAANEHVKSPIFIETESVDVNGRWMIVVTIPEGTDKPYMDKEGLVFLKNGADKRKVTSKEELARLLQHSGNLYAEEMPVRNSTLQDLDWDKFQQFYEQKLQETPDKANLPTYVKSLRMGQDDRLNVAGALLFGKHLEQLLPQFYVAAVWFPGNEIHGNTYSSSENIYGTLSEQYYGAYNFIKTKLNYVQGDRDFNSPGMPEIPLVVFQELLVNALVHRDYFIQDTIKVFVYQNRIEITSPGKLPNSLTVEQMKKGLRRSRNFVIHSFCLDILPYKGIGSGILRALAAYPNIDFINDTDGEKFTAIIHRP
jgi:ATP-dependent DNA helicase RecG